MDFSNCNMLLLLLCSINPNILTYGEFLELYFGNIKDRLNTFQTKLNLICKRDMSDIIVYSEIIENNTSSIAQLVAYLYFTHHKLRIVY